LRRWKHSPDRLRTENHGRRLFWPRWNRPVRGSPNGTKIAFDDFCHNIVETREQVLSPNRRVPGRVRDAIHFDNAPVHKADNVQQNLMNASSADLNIRSIPRILFHVTSFFLVIDMITAISLMPRCGWASKGDNKHSWGDSEEKLICTF
jgi:hypothetical protein